MGPDSEFNITTQQYPRYARIRIEKIEADIKITRTIEKAVLLKNEITRIDVLIENTGTISMPDAEYTDTFPKEIKIIEAVNCNIEGNTIKWEGNLNMNNGQEFRYYIKGIDKIKHKSNATVKYRTGNITDQKGIEVKGSQLSVVTNITPPVIKLGNPAIITITLTNNNSDYGITSLKYRIYIPEALKQIAKTSTSKKIGDYYLHSESLEKSENKTISFTVTAEELGKFQIREEIEYKINNLPDKISNIYDIEITIKKLSLNIPEKLVYKPGQFVNLPIKLANYNSNQKFKNINLDFSSNLPVDYKEVMINEIGPKKVINAGTLSFQIPEEDNKNYSLDIKMAYSTIYNERIKKERTAIIIAKESAEEEITIIDLDEENNQESSQEGLEEETNQQSEQQSSGQGSQKSNIPIVSDGFGKNLEKQILLTLPSYAKAMIIVAVFAVILFIILLFILLKRKKYKDSLEKKLREIR